MRLEDRAVAYDYLVLATGARHAYFGHDEWESVAPGLKKIDDATGDPPPHPDRLRAAPRRAAMPRARRRLLTFVVIGGGPTGVEMAGAIAELARVALRHDFRNIDPREARIVLVEAGPRVLPAFPETLSDARAARARSGWASRCGSARRSRNAMPRASTIGDERLAAATIIWAAGVAASPAARWLGAEQDRAGRVEVGPDLTVPGHPEIFVIGDTALPLDADGKPLPGLAPVAKQQGAYVARAAARATRGPARRRGRSAIATTAPWRRSAGAPPSPTSAGSSSTAPWPGCCGASSTSRS